MPLSNILNKLNLVTNGQNMTVPSNIYVQNVVLALLAQIVGHPYETGGTRFWYSIIQHHCVGLFDWA